MWNNSLMRSRLINVLYYILIVWKCNNHFDPLTTILLTILSGILIRVANTGSFIIKYDVILNYYRLFLEGLCLFIDEKYDVNYGLQLIIFGRFVDIFLSIIKIIPFIKSLIPTIKPALQHLLQKPMIQPIPRKPMFND